MNWIRVSFVLLVSVTVCQTVMGQYVCAGGASSQPYTCSNAGCTDTIDFSVPSGPGQYGGVNLDCFPTSCCGIGGFPTCTAFGGCSVYAKLNDPANRERLVELSKTQDIIIISCSGEYLPLFDALKARTVPITKKRELPIMTGGGE